MHQLPAAMSRPGWIARLPFYYGWINVLVAAVAMTATLPGRTHGLGLITEPLLADVNIDRVSFASINLMASLLGATFCLPVGWLIDRKGVRGALTLVMAALGLSVIGMSQATSFAALAATLLLVRGFGQSALSLASMASIGKWFRRRLGQAMGVFAVLLTFGFIASVLGLGTSVEQIGWRASWNTLGWILLALAPICWVLTRNTPEQCGLAPDEDSIESSSPTDAQVFSLRQALSAPAFWFVTLGASAFNLVWSGVTLFNESILAERGLDAQVAVEIMAILTGVGLIANLACGALVTPKRVLGLLSFGLALLAVGLAAFPLLEGIMAARVYAVCIGLSGGVVTVVFFAAWGHLFGRTQLGRIQGVAQFATVLASSLGPVIVAESFARCGSYRIVFFVFAAITAALAVAGLFISLPTTVRSKDVLLESAAGEAV